MKHFRRSARVAAVAAALGLFAPSAWAGVSIGGDSNWTVKVTTSVGTNSPKVWTSDTGNVNIFYDAHFLGIPLPVTGYYISSFPYMPFARPTMLSTNSTLGSNTYAYTYDGYTGRYAWMVSGKKSFWGDATVNIKGKATADTPRAEGYFHGGTGTGHATDENALDYIYVLP